MCWPFIVLKTWLTGDQQSEGYWVRIGEPCTAIQYLWYSKAISRFFMGGNGGGWWFK